MASQGPNSPGTAASQANGSGSLAWSNPDNAKVADAVYATVAFSVGGTTDFLVLTNFGFSLPGDAVIDGIVVEVERAAASALNPVTDQSVRIVRNSNIGTADRSSGSNWPTTEAYQTYGSSSDLWGEVWDSLSAAAGQINSANFGCAVAAQDGGVNTAKIDHARITVYYHSAGTEELMQSRVVMSQP